MDTLTHIRSKAPWNKGKLTGQKPPFVFLPKVASIDTASLLLVLCSNPLFSG